MSLRETLFDRSRKKARNEFVGSSLTSSRLASERILSLSGSDDRGRLFVMKFTSEWQHPGCSVMKWYSQQCKSSTKFRSIEHRRDAEGPFFHEFLLIKLTDGAVCRVERTGEGSRADAIRYMGCQANDLIQWFSSPDYAAFSMKRPSERIVEVDLCQEFDILDVLAVCYSIQNTKSCRAYTLQRYNCYFLCLTVLAMLARRVASWETKIKADEWDWGLNAVYERWSNLSSDHAQKFAILAICTYLEPDNPRRSQFIFDLLQRHLGSQAEGFTQCDEAIRQALWRTDWKSRLRAALAESLEANPDLFEDTGYCSQQLKRAVETGYEDAEQAIMSCETLLAKHFFRIMAEEQARAFVRLAELSKNLQRLWLIEHPVSFSKLALSRIVGALAVPLLVLEWASPSASDSDYGRFSSCFLRRECSHQYSERRLYSQISLKLAVLKQGSFFYANNILDSLAKSLELEDLINRVSSTIRTDPQGFSIVRVLDRLGSTCVLLSSEALLVLAKWLEADEVAAHLAALAAPGLDHLLSSLMESRQTHIQLTQGDPESDGKCMTVEEFQETYIMHRITAHAKRVAVHQLAAEKFVIEDMEEAMREVWKGLPSGFGAVQSAPSLQEAETVGSDID
ncbi:hypothetical protein FRC09_017434 [Ceratobasidium sp. 395]|nr:hypothetical protein FRC09_017434 [Ceratobasidium sp. 395]